MSIRHLAQEIEKGLKSSLYFLHADDPFLLKEAALMCRRLVPEAERDFSLDVLDMDGADAAPSVSHICDVLNAMPFMGGRRFVLVENAQEFKKKEIEQFEDYVTNPSPYSVLVLLHRGSPRASIRELAGRFRTISLDIRQQDLPLWIREKARQHGFALSNDAIEYLIGIVGPDIGLISSELEKFILIGKKSVDVQDIKALIRGSNDYDAFDLVHALKSGDAQKVFRISRALQETQESYGLLGAINWHYSRMSSTDKDREPYYRKVFELLNEADVRIKTSGGVFPLEYLLIRLLRA